ncbi:MAG: dihydrodipicolinate synthase family protein [Acetobacteraceae bacterium]|nr:dihydrodipicolinate synthase family protein [Acetobacteraceae bacterium]
MTDHRPSSTLKPRFSGIFAALATPFSHRRVDEAGLKGNVRALIRAGLHGFVALGSSGEFPHLSWDEKLSVVSAVLEEAGPAGVPVLAQTGCLTTDETLRLSLKVAELGVQGVLVVTPFYYRPRMTRSALLRHYRAVADECPVPVLLYNMPALTGVNLEPPLVAELALHPNIAGLKDSSANLVQFLDYLRLAPPGFAAFMGSGSLILPALALGAAGVIAAVPQVAPRACLDIYRAVAAGDLARARELQVRLEPTVQATGARFGIPGLKAALNLVGLAGGEVRPPLLDLEPSEVAEVRAALRELGLLAEERRPETE